VRSVLYALNAANEALEKKLRYYKTKKLAGLAVSA
jgi:hypothetical protein